MNERRIPPVPMPHDWSLAYGRVLKAMERSGRSDISPPVPLILAGAAFSTDATIRGRWQELVLWCEEFGYSETLLSALPAPPDNDVALAIAGVDAAGKGWWPEYGNQVHAAKEKPDAHALQLALSALKAYWTDVAGESLAQACRPLRFSGKRGRRLVVLADPAAHPPWGSWDSTFPKPIAFTAFRKRVNAAIQPLEVDHVSFTVAWHDAV